MSPYRTRRLIIVLLLLLIAAVPIASSEVSDPVRPLAEQSSDVQTTRKQLAALAVKGRAPKTGYEREQFGNGWGLVEGCDVRNNILRRDLKNVASDENCKVISGTLHDPYTGRTIEFRRGETTSDDVQIDHVVALSNAWQTGAQQLTYTQRVAFANDPVNLMAVDGPTNEKKSDSDAASWLPPNKPFRCQYVSRQISVKSAYKLWVTPAEKIAMEQITARC